MISNFKLKIKNFVAKLQSLPDAQKKIIVFSVAIIAAIILGFFWIKSSADRISKAGQSFSSVDLPKMELPNFSNTQDTNTPTPSPTGI